MPIKKNAIKYMRVTAHKTEKNKIVKGVVKSAIKKTREAVAAGKFDDAQKFYKEAQKALDKAAEKNIIKKNTAANKKSRLNAFVKKAFLSKDEVKKTTTKKAAAKKVAVKKAAPKKKVAAKKVAA
ncbi:MAG: small subunit ribosomal protein [Patescibacteria group bacterium]|jgi:small subunit ribosomal protein S20|nr:small subunit ribosomal protein [Patescibacteria group bacterium]